MLFSCSLVNIYIYTQDYGQYCILHCHFILIFAYNSVATTELLLQRDLVILEREIVSESDERFSLFKFSKIKDATDNFSRENKLGEGGFGHVYKVNAYSLNIV